MSEPSTTSSRSVSARVINADSKEKKSVSTVSTQREIADIDHCMLVPAHILVVLVAVAMDNHVIIPLSPPMHTPAPSFTRTTT